MGPRVFSDTKQRDARHQSNLSLHTSTVLPASRASSPRVERHTRLEALNNPFQLFRLRHLVVEQEQLEKQRAGNSLGKPPECAAL